VKRWLAVAAAVVFVAAIAIVAVVSADHSGGDSQQRSLKAIAQEFIPPAGSTKAFDDTGSDDPLQAVKGWNSQGTLDAACSSWGQAMKTWVGADNLSGELTPNVDCTYRGTKDGHSVLLSINVFGSAAPQAVLTVR
jgi:hypothetical protein